MDENQQIQAAQPSGMPQRASAVAQSLLARLRGMEGQQRLWLLGAGGLALLCFLGILWFATRTDWKVLYAGLEPSDAREIASELTAANIPFDVSPDGSTLRVPVANLDHRPEFGAELCKPATCHHRQLDYPIAGIAKLRPDPWNADYFGPDKSHAGRRSQGVNTAEHG